MTRIFSYYGALDIGSVLLSRRDLGEFVEYMIGRLNEMIMENRDDDFIPPVVYSVQGKVFNIDYNFMIICLDDYHDKVGIKEDFLLTDSPSPEVMKNALFLVTGVLDNYYDVVRIRQRKLDISKFKTMRMVEIKEKFYNVLLIANGNNVKRFSAVPFSGSEVKKIVSDNAYNLLNSIACSGSFEQVAFGVKQYAEFVKSVGYAPSYVTQ